MYYSRSWGSAYYKHRRLENEFISMTKTDTGAEPVSLGEFKAHARITHTDDDTYIPMLITAARQSIEAYIGQSIVDKDIVLEIRNEAGGYPLPYGPVKEITSVKDENGDTLTDYEFSANNSALTTQYVYAEVSYSTGFETVPEVLKLAILHEANFLYEHRGDEIEMKGVRSVTAKALSQPFRVITWLV